MIYPYLRYPYLIATLCAAFGLPTLANAAVITLDFEGAGDEVALQSFYGGGTAADGASGTDFGVEFSDNALSIIDRDAGGSGNFGNEPTPDTVLFFLTGSAATLNFPTGFDTGFSFFYSAINNPGSIQVFDGIDAMGNILATLELPVTPEEEGDPDGQFNVFVPIGVDFEGTARSIDFGGTINQIAFDNITFGAVEPGDTGGMMEEPNVPPIPLPAGLPLLLAGLGALGLVARRRAA